MTPAQIGSRHGNGGTPALKRLTALRRRGEASPRNFHLLLNALQEASSVSGVLAREVRQSPDLHVAFKLESGAPLGCIELRQGRVITHSDAGPSATQVTLPPATAKRALAGHPAKALIDAYMNGGAKVGGEMSGFMTVIALLEGLAARLGQGVPGRK